MGESRTNTEPEETARARASGRRLDRVEHRVMGTLLGVAAGRQAAAQAPRVEGSGELRIDEVGHAALLGLSARRTASSARCCMDFTAPTVRFVVDATSSSD